MIPNTSPWLKGRTLINCTPLRNIYPRRAAQRQPDIARTSQGTSRGKKSTPNTLASPCIAAQITRPSSPASCKSAAGRSSALAPIHGTGMATQLALNPVQHYRNVARLNTVFRGCKLHIPHLEAMCLLPVMPVVYVALLARDKYLLASLNKLKGAWAPSGDLHGCYPTLPNAWDKSQFAVNSFCHCIPIVFNVSVVIVLCQFKMWLI